MGSGIAPPNHPGNQSRDQSTGDSSEQTSLDDYADAVGPTNRQGKTIDERRQRLEQILDEEIEIVESHQFGSFTRGTMVGPLSEDSDTDVMVVLSREKHGEWEQGENGSRNCLRAVKRVLEKKYPNSKVSIDRNVVSVQFSDFTVEVAPAFSDGAGGYKIPDTYSKGRSWVRTNPRGYKQRFEAVDNARGGRLQKVSRVAKKLRENRSIPVSSYHMEVMAYDYVHNHPDKNASTEELVEGFVEELPRRVSRGTRDPVNGDRLDSSMDQSNRREAIRKAKTARRKMREAKKCRQSGDTEGANEKYGEALGEDVD
ncbi:nucleotidyltransferase [Halogeometricum sp. S1BR25-6]|uniref:Nucleotidyltransferase n=1 Tax=Halogeometricum salsisoli TaxID=2950536 RepID=A0ABU2GBG5_9EURY|nr:CBASS oligonucleotide cyclase [Halogeometricum sp. S1BR25-6]MDS0297534.1 nucleotidyltransferase [Halogeometricum sp. S1BR25-6]